MIHVQQLACQGPRRTRPTPCRSSPTRLATLYKNWQNYVGHDPCSAACLPRAPTYQTNSLQIFSVFFITLSLSTSSPDSGMLAFWTVGMSKVDGRGTRPSSERNGLAN